MEIFSSGTFDLSDTPWQAQDKQQTVVAAQALHASTIQNQLLSEKIGVDNKGQKPVKRSGWFRRLFGE